MDLELQPVALLDGFIDLHVILDFDTISRSIPVIVDLISPNGSRFSN